MKIGLDFGLSVGKKVNQNLTVDKQSLAKNEETGKASTKAFTISK